ncbi:MAG: cardiolipin synthase [Gemmiger sp.]|nr:cardiolipin synthase [Gemmiger sp.]
MEGNSKENVKNSVGRMLFVGVSLILQVCWIAWLFIRLNEYSGYISLASSLLAFAVTLHIYGKHDNAAFKISWIMLILVFPVFGLCLYFLFGRAGAVGRMRKRFATILSRSEGALAQNPTTEKALQTQDAAIANQAYYIWHAARYPIYQGTAVRYYPWGQDVIADQKEELKKAKHFIFMEYHAIEDSGSFREVEKILVDKVRQGVEVRLFYDDVGSIGFINSAFAKRLKSEGIQCRVFNPVVPVINIFMNNRDHRKVTVIDGQVGFTGGYNLADEYFNITHPYGVWKDTGVKLTGAAVQSLTVMFLEMWNTMRVSDESYAPYLPPVEPVADDGFVQPYADSPLDDERVGETVYMNIIKNAKHYLYISTPYLILDDEMTLELTQAAKRGVDVRVMTPGIPDKKLIYQVTRSYYAGLVRGGVRMFEYTPGFNHAKMMLCDDEVATVGTINLDYRSLYLHFENGAYLYHCAAVMDIRRDFDTLWPECCEVTAQYQSDRSTALRIGQCLLRLFAPLM